MGEAVRTNITGNINYQGMVRTEGAASGVGSNYRPSSAGGLAGFARSSSMVSQNLNAGGSVKAEGRTVAAGGITGYGDSSAFSQNLNSAGVETGKTEDTDSGSPAGGILGDGVSVVISNNINTGTAESDQDEGYSGGFAGRVSQNSGVCDNLSTATVRTSGRNSDTAGGVGFSRFSTISRNLSTGSSIETRGESSSHAGGLVGSSEESTVDENLNSARIKTFISSGNAAGVVGDVSGVSTITHNMNIGEIASAGKAGGVVGSLSGATMSSTIHGNLNFNHSLVVPGVGSRIEFPGDVNTLTDADKRGLNSRLESSFWNPGNDDQYPMLRAINSAWLGFAANPWHPLWQQRFSGGSPAICRPRGRPGRQPV